jgi:hypothetical protein
MSFSVSQLLEDVYGELGQLQVSTATGGTSASLVDTKMIDSGADDDWKHGTLMILEAGGDPPEGEYSPIEGYTDSSGTFNLAEEFSTAPQAGDVYGLVSAQYPVQVMLRLINTALRSLGDIPLVDDTTLETTSGSCEIPLQAGWNRRPPYRIEIENDCARWERVYDWEYVPPAPGEDGKICFGKQLPDGRRLRVYYQAPHPRVEAYDHVIAEVIAPSLAVAVCVEQALRWANSRLGGGDNFMLQRWNDAKHTLEQARLQYPIWRPKRNSHLRLAGIGSNQ